MENNISIINKQALDLSLKTEFLTSKLELLPRLSLVDENKDVLTNHDKGRKVCTDCKVIFQKINNQLCNVIGSIKLQEDSSSQIELIKEGDNSLGNLHSCFKDIVFTRLLKEMSIHYPEYYSQLTQVDIETYQKQCDISDGWKVNLSHINQVKNIDIKLALDIQLFQNQATKKFADTLLNLRQNVIFVMTILSVDNNLVSLALNHQSGNGSLIRKLTPDSS